MNGRNERGKRLTRPKRITQRCRTTAAADTTIVFGGTLWENYEFFSFKNEPIKATEAENNRFYTGSDQTVS